MRYGHGNEYKNCMMTIVVNVLVDWIEHKVKGNRYDAQRWARKKRCRKRKNIRSDDYRGVGKNEMEGQKKFPTPRRGVSLFFQSPWCTGPSADDNGCPFSSVIFM